MNLLKFHRCCQLRLSFVSCFCTSFPFYICLFSHLFFLIFRARTSFYLHIIQTWIKFIFKKGIRKTLTISTSVHSYSLFNPTLIVFFYSVSKVVSLCISSVPIYPPCLSECIYIYIYMYQRLCTGRM